jgi:hypothetical protein
LVGGHELSFLSFAFFRGWLLNYLLASVGFGSWALALSPKFSNSARIGVLGEHYYYIDRVLIDRILC